MVDNRDKGEPKEGKFSKEIPKNQGRKQQTRKHVLNKNKPNI